MHEGWVRVRPREVVVIESSDVTVSYAENDGTSTSEDGYNEEEHFCNEI